MIVISMKITLLKAICPAIVPVVCILAGAPRTGATIVNQIESDSTIVINQPAKLDSLLARKAIVAPVPDDNAAENGGEETSVRKTRAVFRVLLYEDNNPLSARRSAESYVRRFQEDFPDIPSYISFNSPYWKVSVGNYRSRGEAQAMLAEFKNAYPGAAPYMRVVRDKIIENE